MKDCRVHAANTVIGQATMITGIAGWHWQISVIAKYETKV
jgi:hypothetical protein